MHQQKLNGYILHHRPYQERRAIYQLFCYEFGLVHGVGVRGMTLFSPVSLYATGKTSLKSFSQICLGFSHEFCQLHHLPEQPSSAFGVIKGRMQYALLYMNEVLCKLLSLESPCVSLWASYHDITHKLHLLDSGEMPETQRAQLMKVYLRSFERALFDELGAVMDFQTDGFGEPIVAELNYCFLPELGFVPTISEHFYHKTNRNTKATEHYAGDTLQQMALADDDNDIYLKYIYQFSSLQKQLMDYLLDYKPLHSRSLWQQSARYHTSH